MPSQSKSAGLLVYRFRENKLEVFLIHPGGPFWKNKDEGAWSIPKGEYGEEEPLQAAIREMKEETGIELSGNFIALTPVKQKGGKLVTAWAVEGEADPTAISSNLFEMEWPPRSGKKATFPEVDKAAWYNLEEAEKKILPAQWPLIEELYSLLNY